MDKPDWTTSDKWRELDLAVEDLVMDFIYSLPDHEFERLRKDIQFWDFIREQIKQKLISTVETYRSKGMYAGFN